MTSSESWPSPGAWRDGGRRIRLPRLGHEVFVRIDGAAGAPPVTLLHGFPSSSHDWAPVLRPLAAAHRVLSLDFLGLGDSDKPAGHPYSLLEQTDLVMEAWEVLGFPAGGALVAHDYGVSVAQELLARGVPVDRIAWLNGGVYPDQHRPIPTQEALAGPDGAALAALATPDLIADTLRTILHRPVPDAILADLADAAARRGGLRNLHLLLGYIRERREQGDRWVAAFDRAAVPYAFIWGRLDPVSGDHILRRIAARFPHAAITALDDVGHYPQIEAPLETASALTAFLAPTTS